MVDNSEDRARCIGLKFTKEYQQRYSSPRKEELLPSMYNSAAKVLYSGNPILYNDIRQFYRSLPDGKLSYDVWDAQLIVGSELVLITIKGKIHPDDPSNNSFTFFKSVILSPDVEEGTQKPIYSIICDTFRQEITE